MKQFLLLLVCLPSVIYSQNITLQGTVLDELNEPLIGVSIYIENTNQGTITNENGAFKFIIKEGASTVSFSYLGYKKEVVTVSELSDYSSLNITLFPYEEVLEEVLVSSIPIPDLLKNVVETSKNKLKESAVLTTYNRELLKTDSTYSYFAEGVVQYHLKGQRKKIKSNTYVQNNRVLNVGLEDKAKFIKANPFGYNVRDIVKKSFKKNLLLNYIFKLNHRYDFILKSKTINESTVHNIVEFSPKEDDFTGSTYKGYVVYDANTQLILEFYIKKASNKIEDASKIESFVLTFSQIDQEQKISYRLEGDKYILVYNKSYMKYYIGNIFFNTYDKEYSFYNDLTVLDYKEGVFDFKGQKKYKDDYLFSLGNQYTSPFWENISISESKEEKEFKEFYEAQ